MSTENKTPLWKELNEKRTQGEAMLYKSVLPNNHLMIGVTTTNENGETQTIFTALNFSSLDIDLKDKKTKQAEANAAYTCLAVNNLNTLAETLQKCLAFTEAIEQLCHEGKLDIDRLKQNIGVIQLPIREALQNIS